MNLIKKQQSVFLAALMMLLLAGWFAPHSQSAEFLQVDFWVLWFFCMTILALPMLYLEVALAKRSKKTPMIGMEELTRQADAVTFWRVSSWLSVVLLALVTVGLLNTAATGFTTELPKLLDSQFDTSPVYVLIGLTLLAVALSFTGVWTLLLAFVLAIAAVVMSGVNVGADWRVTGTSLVEWKNAVTLALLSTGVGLGLYWQNNLTKAAQQRESTMTVLPIWFAQVVAGIVFALFQGVHGSMAVVCYGVATIAAAAMLIAYLRQNMQSKFAMPKSVLVVVMLLLVGVVLWSLPFMNNAMIALVSVLGFVVVTLYAVFAGWQMKISHLRKSIAFDSEVTYNIWRVAVRLVVPMSVLLALVGLGLSFA